MSKLLIIPLFFLSLLPSSLAIIGLDGCQDNKDGCLDCAKAYTISGTHVAIPYGCYQSKGNKNGNALPYFSLINYNKGKDRINKRMWDVTKDASQIISEFCGKYAVQMGYDYFGVENYSECYFGYEDEINGGGLVAANDCAKKCKWDVGIGNYMMIFSVKRM